MPQGKRDTGGNEVGGWMGEHPSQKQKGRGDVVKNLGRRDLEGGNIWNVTGCTCGLRKKESQ